MSSFEDKYHLTSEQSIFLAKKKWDENVYCGMKMENRSAFRWEMIQEIRGTTMITDNNLRNVSRVIQYLILF